jgi:hypothetical protein
LIQYLNQKGLISMTVNLSDIIDALNFTDEYTHNFLDKTTEEIVWVSDMAMNMKEQEKAYDTLDAHGFYRLPEQRDIHEYRVMEDFISSLPAGVARDCLSTAIHGKGAFRRFKDSVIRLGLDQRWYQWRDEAYKRKAIEWCEENGITYV